MLKRQLLYNNLFYLHILLFFFFQEKFDADFQGVLSLHTISEYAKNIFLLFQSYFFAGLKKSIKFIFTKTFFFMFMNIWKQNQANWAVVFIPDPPYRIIAQCKCLIKLVFLSILLLLMWGVRPFHFSEVFLLKFVSMILQITTLLNRQIIF